MQKNKFIILLIGLVSILSCEQNVQDIDKIAQEPEIIEIVDLKNEIGQPPFNNASVIPYYLPNNKLLLYSTQPFPIPT